MNPNPEELTPSREYTGKSETALVPLSELYVPTWNPRPVIDEDELLALMAYIQNGGIIPRIMLWQGDGQPATSSSELAQPSRDPRLAASAQVPLAIISGQMRAEAYRRLGKTHIEAEIYDISLQKAKILALTANTANKPHWLGEFEALANIQTEYPDLYNVELRPAGWNDKRVSYALSLTKLLTPAAKQLIRQSKRKKLTDGKLFRTDLTQDPADKATWELTEYVAYRLSPLLDNPSLEAAQAQAEKAVQVIIDHQLSSAQTADLVTHLLAGGDSTQYQPAAKVRKARTTVRSSELGSSQPKPTTPNSPLLTSNSTPQAPNSIPPVHPSPTPDSPHPQTPGSTGQVFWEWVAGISFISQIKSKLKKGEPLSLGEKTMVSGWRFVKGIGWVLKHALKLSLEVLKIGWKFLKEADKFVEKNAGKKVSKVLRWVTALVIVGGLWYGYHLHPLHRLKLWVCKVFAAAWVSSPAVSSLPDKASITQSSTVAESPKEESSPQTTRRASAPRSQTEGQGLNVPISHKQEIGASAPRSQTEGQDLNVPISHKQEIGASALRSQTEGQDLNVPISPKQEVGTSAPRSQTEGRGLNVPISPKPEIGASAPRSQTEGQGLNVPISHKQEIGASAPAVTAFTEGSGLTQSYLEMEIAALPPNSVIESFSFTPDEGMGLTMASRRVSDLTDRDKFTMKLGRAAKKILTVNATTTNFTVTYQDADQIGGFLNGTSKMDYYWEDVKAIHVNTIQSAAGAIYQMTLVAAEAKQPFTVQCHSPADLQHLVSALKFWFKTFRGTAAPPVLIQGMPYLSQGLRLNNDSALDLLWADSPAAKAGLVLGDRIWSLEKNTDNRQSKTQLETALQALAPGQHILYKVTAEGWQRALADMRANQLDTLMPLRHRVRLNL